MAEFGWAFLSGAVTGGGPSGSIQYVPTAPNGTLTGSQQFTWNNTSKTLFVSGTLILSGALKANTYDIIHTTRTEITQYGATTFGDDANDLHQFSGSVRISGSMNLSYKRITTESTYTIQPHTMILGVSGSGYKSISLPGANSVGAGRVVTIKDEYNSYTRSKVAGTHIAVSASGGHKIDHQSTFDIEGDNVALSLYSDGVSKWFIY